MSPAPPGPCVDAAAAPTAGASQDVAALSQPSAPPALLRTAFGSRGPGRSGASGPRRAAPDWALAGPTASPAPPARERAAALARETVDRKVQAILRHCSGAPSPAASAPSFR